MERLLKCGHEVTAVTGVPLHFLHDSIGGTEEEMGRFRLISHEKMDVGLLQRDSVTVEYEETIANLSAFFSEESLTRKTNSIVSSLLSPFVSNSQELWGREGERATSLTGVTNVSHVRESNAQEERERDTEERERKVKWVPDIFVTDISILALLVRDEITKRIRENNTAGEGRGETGETGDDCERREKRVVMITNFTWPCIYGPLVAVDARFQRFIDQHRRAYARVDSLLVLPFSLAAVAECGVPKDRIRTIGGVSRISTVPVETVKHWLRKRESSLPRMAATESEQERDFQKERKSESESEVKYLLYSFGGFKAPIEECMQVWKPPPPDWRLVWVDRSPPPTQSSTARDSQLSNALGDVGKGCGDTESEERNGTPQRPTIERVMVIGEWELEEAGLKYVDLLAAMDVALIKTGFGIVSECIRYRTSVLYVDRPGFEEHKALAAALALQISSREVDLERAKAADVFGLISDVWPNRLEPHFAFTGVDEAVAHITAPPLPP